MAIKTYKKEVSKNKFVIFYKVSVEAINIFTGKRKQKYESGIPSLPKAKKLERELWFICREGKHSDFEIERWGMLRDRYLADVESRVRKDGQDGDFSPNTVINKRGRLEHTKAWDSLHFKLITPQFVKKELDKFEIEKGMSRPMTAGILKEIKTTFTFAVHVGVLEANPFEKVSRKVDEKEKDALTLEEVNKLLSKAWTKNHPFFLVWLLSAFLGVRRSELAGLKWTDIDFVHRLVKIQRQRYARAKKPVERTKTGKNRIVPLTTNLVPVLKSYQQKSNSEFVISFTDPDSRIARFWESGNQAHVLREFCREIGIKEIAHKDLRATFITLALADNCPLGVVKEMVGHAKLSTTDIYFRRSGLHLKGQTDKLSMNVPTGPTADIIKLAIGDNEAANSHQERATSKRNYNDSVIDLNKMRKKLRKK